MGEAVQIHRRPMPELLRYLASLLRQGEDPQSVAFSLELAAAVEEKEQRGTRTGTVRR